MTRYGPRIRKMHAKELNRGHVRLFREVTQALLDGSVAEQTLLVNSARRLLELQGHRLHPNLRFGTAVRQMADDCGVRPERVGPILKSLRLASHGDEGFAEVDDPAAVAAPRVLAEALDLRRRSDKSHFEGLVKATDIDQSRLIAEICSVDVAALSQDVEHFARSHDTDNPSKVKADKNDFDLYMLNGWKMAPFAEDGSPTDEFRSHLRDRGWLCE